MIDKDTPSEAYTKVGVGKKIARSLAFSYGFSQVSWYDGSEMELVFSDEFETPGRSFYPGDDPYWEAVDLHNWATNDLEWCASSLSAGSIQTCLTPSVNVERYDPSAITTVNGVSTYACVFAWGTQILIAIFRLCKLPCRKKSNTISII